MMLVRGPAGYVPTKKVGIVWGLTEAVMRMRKDRMGRKARPEARRTEEQDKGGAGALATDSPVPYWRLQRNANNGMAPN